MLLLSGCAPTPTLHCEDPVTPIPDVQGTGERSPLNGTVVTVSGVVTVLRPGREDERSGFFLQQDLAFDGRSNGLYVDLTGPLPQPGTQVLARGQVHETDALTSLAASHWIPCGDAEPPTPQPFHLGSEDPEPLEGMRVSVQGPVTVTDVYRAGQGQIGVAANGRLWQPTEVAEPGEPARQVMAQNRARSMRVILPGPMSELRAGNLLTELQGVLFPDRGLSLVAMKRPRQDAIQPRADAPPPLGNLRIVGFNLLNYFNGDGRGGGFPTDRGAATGAEFQRQESKLLAALKALDADILSLSELENDGFGKDSAVAGLAQALSGVSGRDYHFARPDQGLGAASISVGILYDASLVKPIGPARTTLAPPFHQLHRPPVAQTFEIDGVRLTVVAVHLKSKSCAEASGTNADQGDGQGCWNAARVEASHGLVEWVAGFAAPDSTLLIGDFNAHTREDPLRTAEAMGFGRLAPDTIPDHSFVYLGHASSLDHALAGPALARQVRAVRHWHINADAPEVLSYRRADAGLDAVRSSDHDPLVVDLEFPPR